MLLSYLWQAKAPPSPGSYQAFSDVLASERDLYAEAWGRTPDVSIWSHESLFVGQIRYDPGIKGFEAWVDHGTQGLAWGGVCESFLGEHFTPEKVSGIVETCNHRPKDLIAWDGRFSLSCWDRAAGRVTLATGATQSPTLWYTEGPGGWAVSSRAAPILELVGRPKAPNMAAIDLFLLCGYLIDGGCLFEGVERVPSRRVLTFEGHGPPRSSVYATSLDVLRSEEHPRDRSEAIEVCRDRLIRRVDVEQRNTIEPILLLTGGRDSRLIAAAAARAGYEGKVHSGGSPESSTVRVAGRVASALGLKRHPGWADGYFPPGTVPEHSLDNLKLWTRLSEGIETIRHGLTWQDFFARSLPCPVRREVSFHGLAGEFGRGSYCKGLSLRSLRKVGANHVAREQLRKWNITFWDDQRPEASRLLNGAFERFEEDLGEAVSVATWLDLFYWQRRVLQWGEDSMLVRSPITWTWTPLQDRALFGAYLALPSKYKYGSRFVEDLTVAIAPELRGVPYDQKVYGPPGVRTSVSRARKALGRARRRLTRPKRSPSVHPPSGPNGTHEVWDVVFLGEDKGFWRELVEEEALRDLIDRDPNSEALWNLATVELFMRTNF